MTGNVFTGETVITSPGANSFIRVMHMSFGWPLISALQEPHFPALQFQRTARSGACAACIRWTTSRTTMPGSDGTANSTNAPPVSSPRHTFIRMFVAAAGVSAVTRCPPRPQVRRSPPARSACPRR